MQRRDLLLTLGGLLAGARPARAGAADKIHRIGFLASGGANASANLVEAFRLGMRFTWTHLPLLFGAALAVRLVIVGRLTEANTPTPLRAPTRGSV